MGRAAPGAGRFVLLHRLYDYLDFTSELESSTVIPVATAIARGRGGFPAPGALRADAFKIVTDEAWHAQFSDDLVRQLEAYTGQSPIAHVPAFRPRLDRLLEEVEPALRPGAALTIAVCSETLISGLLSKLPNDRRLPAAVSATVRDHAEDEGRHHAYFRTVLDRFWRRSSSPTTGTSGARSSRPGSASTTRSRSSPSPTRAPPCAGPAATRPGGPSGTLPRSAPWTTRGRTTRSRPAGSSRPRTPSGDRAGDRFPGRDVLAFLDGVDDQ